MICLPNNTDVLQIKLVGAKSSADNPFLATYQDEQGITEVQDRPPAVYRTSGITNGTTLVTVMPAQGGSPRFVRKLKTFQLTNQDNAQIQVQLILNDGTNSRIIQGPTLQVGEMMEYEDGYGFSFFDVNGALKSQAAATSSASSVADSKAVSVSGTVSTNLSAATVSFSLGLSQATSIGTSLSTVASTNASVTTSQATSLSVVGSTTLSTGTSSSTGQSTTESSRTSAGNSVTLSKTKSSFGF